MTQGRKKTGGKMLAQAASEYIETHYKEKFSLQKMAGDLYVNGSYLLRVFKKHTGTTPLAYHNHVRCAQARELLGPPKRAYRKSAKPSDSFPRRISPTYLKKKRAARLPNTEPDAKNTEIIRQK